MDRFDCCGHQLDLQRQDNEIVARCQCGQWQNIVRLSDASELTLLVSRLVGEHNRHIDGLGRTAPMDAGGVRLPVFPKTPTQPGSSLDRGPR